MENLREVLIKFSKYRENKIPYSAVINHEKFVEEFLINSSNEPDELRAVGKHEQKEEVCEFCDGTHLIRKVNVCNRCQMILGG